jgi:hypothetical protein
MTGALNFTLGLGITQFANNLGIAGGKLVSFMGVTQLVAKSFNSMWDAVQQGGRLTDLAASASISVEQLYKLQFAFEQVGAKAESVTGIISRLRTNLAQGNQDSVLKQLGLDPSQVKALDAAAQFEKISASLSRLDVVSRAGAAQALFGREGAETAQIIANSGAAWATAWAAAAKDAKIWGQVAETFDAIADKVTALQRQMQTMWAQIAGTLVGAWKSSRMDELIALTFQAGMEKAVQVFQVATDAMAEIFAATLGAQSLWDGLRQVIASMFVGLGTSLMELLFGPIADAIGDRAGFNERQQERVDYAAGMAKAGAKNMARGGNEAFPAVVAAMEKAFLNIKADGPAAQALKTFSAEMLRNLNDGSKPQMMGSGLDVDFKGSKASTTDFTSIEKMGGVLLGLGRGFGGDEARQTASNTRRTADLLTQTNQLLTQQGQANYANI